VYSRAWWIWRGMWRVSIRLIFRGQVGRVFDVVVVHLHFHYLLVFRE
jgi:hypothetical protein